MLSIAPFLLSVILIVTGNMPLAGGKRKRGGMVRLGGAVMLLLSISLLFIPNDYFIIMMGIIFGLYALTHFLATGEEPTEKEKISNMWNSREDEISTYKETVKNIAFVAIGMVGIYFMAMSGMKIISFLIK